MDLDACVWLEEELRNYKRILVMVSHSQDFLNGVCTNIVHLTKQKLFVYGVSLELKKKSMKQENIFRVIMILMSKQDKN